MGTAKSGAFALVTMLLGAWFVHVMGADGDRVGHDRGSASSCVAAVDSLRADIDAVRRQVSLAQPTPPAALQAVRAPEASVVEDRVAAVRASARSTVAPLDVPGGLRAAERAVADAVSVGRWTDDDVLRFRSTLAGLGNAERDEAISRLVQAINAQQLRFEVTSGTLF